MATMDLKQYDGLSPVAAQIMGMLDFGRDRLISVIKDLTPEQLLKQPAGFKNSIATLILHVGNTEVMFSHRIMGKTVADELKAEFPPHLPGQPLTAPEQTSAAQLIASLEKSRGFVLESLKGLSDADLAREIPMGPDRSATVRWLVGLLPGHQSQHYGHVQMIAQHL